MNVLAVAQTDDPRAIALKLKDPDPAVRTDAAKKLDAMGAAAAPAIPELADALIDSVASVRHAVLHAFATLGPRAADAAGMVAIMLGHEEAETQILAADALAKIDAPASSVGPLTRTLLDDDGQVRERCAQVLGGFGPASMTAVPRLIRLADTDTSAAVRAAAKQALDQIAPAKGRVQRVAAGMRSKDKTTQLTTAAALAEMGSSGRAAIPYLTRAFHDPDSDVRFAAATAAVAIAPDSASVRKGVLALVTNPQEDRFARTKLTQASGEAHLPLIDGVPALVTQTKSSDVLVQKGAVVILGLVRPVGDAAVQALIAALGDPSPDVRGLAAESLGEIGKEAQAALPSLDHMMKTDRDTAARNFASAAYYRISP
jgi:HEAT repeat protein